MRRSRCSEQLRNVELINSPSRTRTYDTSVNSRMLYRLSYRGILKKIYFFKTESELIKSSKMFRKRNIGNNRISLRPISKCQLRALLLLHTIPIYLILSKGSYYLMVGISHLEGGFTLRCLQRLSLPDLATLPWGCSPTAAPVVRPSRSSRTKDSSSQISSACAG